MSTKSLNASYLNARISILASRLMAIESVLVDSELNLARAWRERQDEFDATDRGTSVEQAQLGALLRDIRLIVRPLTGANLDFLLHAVHLLELANLKTIIRGKLAGLGQADIETQLLDLGDFATLPTQELLQTEDAAEALRRLEATPYFDIARQARRAYEERHDMFAVDAAIDRHYFLGLKRRAESVPRSERIAVVALTGVLMDHTNLIWLLRYRISFGFSPAATYYQLVPSSAQLNSERLRQLARLARLQDVIDLLPSELGRWVAGAEGVSEVEDRLEQRLESISNFALKKKKHPVARAFAYFLRRDLDMRRLVAVIKGKHLGLDPGLIRIAARTAG